MLRDRSPLQYLLVATARAGAVFGFGMLAGCLLSRAQPPRARAARFAGQPEQEATTKLHECEARIRRLTSELLLAEERERRQLAIRLHDDVGQSLAVAKMRLARLIDPSMPGQVREIAGQAREFVDEALQQARTLTSELSPPILYDVGLSAALKWLGSHFTTRHGLNVEVLSEVPSGVLREEDRVLFFQACRELLMNVVKHAQANAVTVELSRNGRGVCLKVQDDGVGFSPRDQGVASANSDTFGLYSIRERVAYCGGRMDVASESGAGTCITLEVPVEFVAPEGARTDVA